MSRFLRVLDDVVEYNEWCDTIENGELTRTYDSDDDFSFGFECHYGKILSESESVEKLCDGFYIRAENGFKARNVYNHLRTVRRRIKELKKVNPDISVKVLGFIVTERCEGTKVVCSSSDGGYNFYCYDEND